MPSLFRTLWAFLSLPLLVVLALLQTASPAIAQNPVPQTDRIATNADLRSTTRLSGHIPAWAIAANDAGPAPSTDTLRLTLVLTRSTARQAAFNQLLADQQNPSSPNFHHWLTPQQIGALYGPTQNDLNSLSAWLTEQGIQVREIAPSGLFITAEVPVSTVTNALSVNLRSFSLRDPATGQATTHIATTTEPAIPSAFASVVSAIKGLSDAPVYSMHHTRLVTNAHGSAAAPQVTSSTGDHYITPNDFATLYGISASYQAGITGANQKVAIVGRSRVDATDITNFEKMTGLTAKQPNIIVAGTDPGVTNTGDQDEATLDVERVFGTAPCAQVDLVISTTIETAAQYEVQTLRDPILSIGFGSCEASAGSSVVTFWDSLFSQAAVEGISTFVSSGDTGVDGCEAAGTIPAASQTASINALCASSYATCVGGTEFADFAQPSMYWSSSNGTGQTALGPIPEGAWNEPTTTSGSTTVSNLSATGGGASTFIAKPTWQTGTGVPADSWRDVPDLSFSASMHDGYLSCLSYTGSDCTNSFIIFSGTSAAAPSMAGIAALLNQKAGGAQGNLNPLLYRLAVSTTGGFQDVTPTTSGVALCVLSTPSMCNNSIPGSTVGSLGLAGYAVTTGYDQATGLGSLQVTDFLTAATNAAQQAPVVVLTPQFTTIAAGASETLTAIVNVTGAHSPTGTVQFFEGTTNLATVSVVNGAATTAPLAFNTAGTFQMTAFYSGDANFLSSTSAAVPITVTTGSPYQLVATPASITLTAGATSGNGTTVNIQQTSNFVGNVSLSCTVSYNGTSTPSDMPTCAFQSNSLPISGGPVSSLLTITTVAHQATSAAVQAPPFTRWGGITVCSLLLCLIGPRRLRQWRHAIRVGALLILFVVFTGCGGSSSGTTSSTSPTITPPPAASGTTSGSYTVTVTSTNTAGVPAPAPLAIPLTVN
jgi:subtilase family serine protease